MTTAYAGQNSLPRAAWLALVWLMVLPWAAVAAAGGDYERPGSLPVSRILPPRLLSSPHHKVSPRVKGDHFINHYLVTSELGEFKAVSTPGLIKLIHELEVISLMRKVEQEDTYSKSVEESGKRTWQGIKVLVTKPGDTLEGAAQGMERLFERAGESLTGAQRSQAEDSRAKQMIGFSKVKREIAAKFKVDVYSANKVLQAELDRLAWADYGGGISFAAVNALIPGGAGIALTASGSTRLLNDLIDTTPPAELRILNRNKLAKMGIARDRAELFLNNTNFSPRDQTTLVAALDELKGVANRELFLMVAVQASDRDLAFLIARMASLFAGYQQKVAKLVRFHPVARVLYATSAKGALVFNAPTDYILWSRALEGILATMDAEARRGPGVKAKELWTTGGVSPRAAAALKQRGWRVHLDSGKMLLGERGFRK